MSLMTLLLAVACNAMVAFLLLPRLLGRAHSQLFQGWIWFDHKAALYGWVPIAAGLLAWDYLVWKEARPKVRGWFTRKLLTLSLAAGVALVDSPPTASAGKLPFTARIGFVPVLGQALRSALITNGEVKSALQNAFAPHYPVSPQFITDFWHMTYTSYTQSHSADSGYLQRQPLAARLTALGLPVLAIYGNKDAIVSPAAMRKDFSTVPHAQVVAIAGAGHSPMVEKPYATAAYLLPFAAATLPHG